MKPRKFDKEKLRYDLLPAPELEELVEVYTHGANKYGDKNYLVQGGLGEDRIYAAILRHLQAYRKCERIDKDSGLPALAHAVWGCFTLMEYERLGYLKAKPKRKASKRYRVKKKGCKHREQIQIAKGVKS